MPVRLRKEFAQHGGIVPQGGRRHKRQLLPMPAQGGPRIPPVPRVRPPVPPVNFMAALMSYANISKRIVLLHVTSRPCFSLRLELPCTMLHTETQGRRQS